MTQKSTPNGTISTEVNNNIKGHKKHPSNSFLSKFIALPQGLRVKSKGGENEGKQSPRRPVPVKALPSGGFISKPGDLVEDLTEANNNVFIHLEHCENNSSIQNSPLTLHSRNPSVSSFASSQDGSINSDLNSEGSQTPRRSGRYRKRSSSTPPDIGRQRSSPVDKRIGRLANQYYQAVYNNNSQNVNTFSPVDHNTNWSRHSNSSDTGISLDSDDSFDFGDIEDVDFDHIIPRESSTPLDNYHPSKPVTRADNFSPAGVKTMMHPHYLTLPRNTKFQSDSAGQPVSLVKVDNSLRPMAYPNGTVPNGRVMTAGGSLKLRSPGLVVYKPPPGAPGNFIMMGDHSLHNGEPGNVPFKSQGVTDIHDLPNNRWQAPEASNLYNSRGLSSSMPTLLGNATPKEQKKFLKEVKKLEKEEKKRREKEEKRRIKEEKKREKTLRKQKKLVNRTLPRNWVSGYVERPIENVYHRRPQLQFSAVPIDFEDGPPTHRSNPPLHAPPPPPPQTLQQGPSLKAQAFYNSAPDLLRLEKVYGGSVRGQPKEYHDTQGITNGGFTLHRNIPNTHYYSEYAPRSVVLQKGPEGYGFVLRGAKSQTQATGELDFRPSAEFPALQYLDSVDPGSRADRAGLKTGDFILEINGENVVRASHDRVVQLIRQSGDTLALKVVTVKPLEKPDHWLQHHNGTMTLPNRGGTRRQAPQPPQRDPQTSLSVGKAQGKQFTEGMAELERTVQELNSSTEDQLDLALAEYERQTVQSVVSSDQKTASIRSKHSAKRVSCVELDKIENPDSKAATTKGKVKDYMSPSEIRIQKYHHKKAGGNLERSSSTPSLVDKKNEAVYATPTVPSTEQNDIGHRRSSSGAAISHIYATPGERPKAPPPPPPSGSSTPSPKRPAPAPPERPQSEIISISTDRRKSSLSSVTDSLLSTEKPASEYESSFRPGISAQLTTEPKMSTPSLQQAKLRSHNRNSSQVSVNSNDSGGSKRSEEKLGVTFADDKVQDHANLFLQKHPNAQLLVTADVHAKNKDRKMSEPEPDYDSDENDDKVKSKVTVISVGGGSEGSKKYTVKSDIPSGGGGMVIPPPPSEPAPKPPGHKPPSPLPKPAKQDTDIKISFSTEKKVIEENFVKNNETSSVKSEETVSFSSKTPEPEPLNVPPAPPAPPPPPPPPPAPDVSAHVEKPKTPPPVSEKKPKSVVQGIPSKDIMAAVAQRKTRIESEGLKISTGPNKEAPVKDGKDLRNRMIDNTHSAILAAVAKRRALLEEKESDHSVAEEIENRLQKTKKLQSAKYFFSSESIQKKEAEKLNKVETKTETSAKEITPTIVKPTTPTAVSPKTTKPPSPVPSKKTKPPSPSPVRKISPPTPGAKTLPSATKTTTAPNPTKTVEKTQNAPKPIYSSSAKPPSPKLKKAPSPVPIKSPAPETTPDKPKAKAPATPSSPQKDKKDVEKDENEDLLAKAEKARQDWLQKKSSSSSLRSPRDVTRNPSKLNSPRRTASKAGTKTENSETKKESPSSTKTTPKTNGMTLPLKNEESNGTSVQNNQTNTAKSSLQIHSTKSPNKSGITPMKTAKDSDVLMKTRNIKDRIANFEKEKPLVNGKSDGNSKIPVHGVTVDSSLTDKSPALPPPPEFGDALQLEIIPPPSGFNVNDTLESPTYNSAFHHSDSSSVSTLSTLSDDHIDSKTKHSYEDLIAPPPPGFDDNSEDTVPSVIPPPPDFGGNKPAQKSNKTVNKPFLSKPLSNWQCLDVLDWLDSIEMAQYKKSFQQHCIDGKKLNGLQRNDYIQLGVTQVGHRMMMERAIKKASNIVTGTHL
ncbi:SH3 and multiple ankyrin repeat domains protein 3-like isoform X3 [Saccostrea echinata]|uniref:SH3 and multiple ankyrin repeat domains protein 3-like isoform X3 n=1 Tax=Saccostrea echinata TaxID=191078 RepID=UPI002A7FDE19|nr:SH3 and multiple ankyrin repeat domains protein 3-like isoform X3 [Saccostrea echinata]